MSDVPIDVIQADPMIFGYTQALKAVVEHVKKSSDLLLREQMPVELGKQEACKTLSAQMNGIIAEVRSEAEAGNVDGAEAMARRDIVLKAKRLIETYHSNAATEYVMLKGESRAVQKQVDLVSKLLANKLNEESRKIRQKVEMDAERALRGKGEDVVSSVQSEDIPVNAKEVVMPTVGGGVVNAEVSTPADPLEENLEVSVSNSCISDSIVAAADSCEKPAEETTEVSLVEQIVEAVSKNEFMTEHVEQINNSASIAQPSVSVQKVVQFGGKRGRRR